MDQETQQCPICGRLVRPRRHLGGQVLACPRCTAGWTNPPPPVAHEDYVEDRVTDAANYLNNAALHRVLPRRVAHFLQHTMQRRGETCSGRALDVGCSVGFLVEELNRLGYAAEGVEPNETAVRVARENGLTVHLGVLDTQIPTGAYALVTMSHTLEHVDSPLAVLAEVRRVLQPGGLLVLIQPDYRGLVARLLPTKWYGWQTSTHYWHFTVPSLSGLLGKAGFKVVAVNRNSLHHPWPRVGEGNWRYYLRQMALSTTAKVGTSLNRGDQIFVMAEAPAAGPQQG